MAGTDSDLYKDKIEVSLDGRQIFYLFFGGAVVACLVFVLGVMVGRRLEARGHIDKVASTSVARDPLAALDRLSSGSGSMTFPTALTGSGGPTATVDREIAAMGARRRADAARPMTVVADEGATASVDAGKAAAAKVDAAKADAAKAAAAKAAAAKPDAAPNVAVAKPDPAASNAKFTLQLSAFQDNGEAQAFLSTVKTAGYAAYITPADVDGKTFYRVRVGSYTSYDDAVAAKAEFEKKVPKIAYVTRL
jgi:DedD protein